MTKIRRFALALCALAAAVLFGCSDSSNSSQTATLSVTPKAAVTIKQMIADQALGSKPLASTIFLRVRATPGGCQGYQHKLDLDTDTTSEDLVCESSGVKVVIFKRQAEMLKGTQIDYGEENGKLGFMVDNPNFNGESAKKWLAILEKETDIH